MCRALCQALEREEKREHPGFQSQGSAWASGAHSDRTGSVANVHMIISRGACNEGEREVVRGSQEPSYREALVKERSLRAGNI